MRGIVVGGTVVGTTKENKTQKKNIFMVMFLVSIILIYGSISATRGRSERVWNKSRLETL